MALTFPAEADTPGKKVRFLLRLRRRLNVWLAKRRDLYPEQSFEVITAAEATASGRVVLRVGDGVAVDDWGVLIPTDHVMVEAVWVPQYRAYQTKYQNRLSKLDLYLQPRLDAMRASMADDRQEKFNNFITLVGEAADDWDTHAGLTDLDEV